MNMFRPVYLGSMESGRLRDLRERALRSLQECRLCPRDCGVNRKEGETGVCRTGYRAVVASYAPHFGEEAPLVGTHGSGTIFFSYCNLRCSFCQNWDISHGGAGTEVTASHLARIMLHLQSMGCHNINLVTPSHVIPQIIAALEPAAAGGLRIPIVYNTSAYDKPESLKLLDGLVDIYMPDFKFWDPAPAGETCNAPDYPERARESIREMHRQAGDLKIVHGIAVRGLLVRHLVMPGGIAGTREIMRFLAREISPDTYVNIMAQYHPCGSIGHLPGLQRRISREEYAEALIAAREEGIRRLDR
ncbi:MAG: radical SAM protein [Bacteroidales bacterium]|nr:radical SAM protein [Bacteroidales bacterium]